MKVLIALNLMLVVAEVVSCSNTTTPTPSKCELRGEVKCDPRDLGDVWFGGTRISRGSVYYIWLAFAVGVISGIFVAITVHDNHTKKIKPKKTELGVNHAEAA